jgi:hypothetical protein
MRSDQRKISIAAMIERHLSPAFDNVARLTFFAKAPCVYILNAVAADAVGRKVSVDFARVACRASDIAVGSLQSEVRLGVIKRSQIDPISRFVAGRAIIAKTAQMRLLFFVAVRALSRRVTKLGLGQMARSAGQDRMRIFQQKFCIRVIKRFFVELDDVFVPSLVVCVTVATFLLQHFAPATVKSAIFCNVAINFFVAGNAKLGFTGFRKRDVTIRTVAYQFGVPFDQIAGHNQPFKKGLRRSRNR